MKTEASVNEIELNGVAYVRKDAMPAPQPNGRRAVVVVDRGWIFAGDVTEENGRIYLDRAVWVFNWSEIGFSRVVEDPTNKKINLRRMSTRIDIPADSEIFRCPVGDSWGL